MHLNRYAPAPKPLAPDKGKYGGSCNRTACQEPNSAFCVHRLNHGDHYCIRCARLINEANMSYDGKPIVTIPENYSELWLAQIEDK